jgi:hypothetical protein
VKSRHGLRELRIRRIRRWRGARYDDLQTAEHGIEAYLHHVLDPLPAHLVNQVEQPLPWNLASAMSEMKLAA